MKIRNLVRLLIPLFAASILASCASNKGNVAAEAAPVSARSSVSVVPGQSAAPAADELDEYAAAGEISDPLETLNRATFVLNDKLYTVFFRPVSKGYEKALPRRVRKGIDNVFDNVRFPARFVNCALQGKFKRAGQETEKLLVNTIAGLGGLIRVSDKIPSLADVPEEDTGQTFAAWGIGHGAYLVLPFYGPSSVREGVGLAGDYALNPINWGTFWHGDHDWTMAVQGGNTLRLLPAGLSTYDAATQDAVDPYLSVRNAYIQNRAEAVRR